MTLNELLNSIVEEFECEAIEANEFAYYYAESEIHYTLKDDEKEADDFLAFARKNGLDSSVSAFVISFFHEIGHNETIDELDDDEYYEGNKDSLSKEDYYNLTEEFIATKWAIDYCNTHLDLVKKIQKMLDK